jgi:Tol biopolymer transport system component
LLSIGDGNTPRPLLHESWREGLAVFSPDGNWIAYASDAEGRLEVYVTPFPGLGKKEKISTDGGCFPVWSRDGKELFYRNGDKMMVTTIETEPEFRVAGSDVLFEGQYLTSGGGPNYDVSPDGRQFLMVKESGEQAGTNQLIVVVNWFEELKRLVPTGKK